MILIPETSILYKAFFIVREIIEDWEVMGNSIFCPSEKSENVGYRNVALKSQYGVTAVKMLY